MSTTASAGSPSCRRLAPSPRLAAGMNAGAGFVVGVLTGSFDATALGRERHTHLLPGVASLPEIL